MYDPTIVLGEEVETDQGEEDEQAAEGGETTESAETTESEETTEGPQAAEGGETTTEATESAGETSATEDADEQRAYLLDRAAELVEKLEEKRLVKRLRDMLQHVRK